MLRTADNFGEIFPRIFFLLFSLAIGCDRNSEIFIPDTSSDELKRQKPDRQDRDRDDMKDEDLFDKPKTRSGDLFDNDANIDLAQSTGKSRKVEYPFLSFNGNGFTQCGESYTTTTAVTTKISDATLVLDMTAARLHCGGECEKRSQEELQQKAIGPTTYDRITKAEKAKLKEDGFKWADYAIFAKAVTKKTGLKFTFDTPLPVFPWPAPASRYASLQGSTETWTSKVTSSDGRIFTTTISVSLVSETSDEVTLKLDNLIAEDRDRSIYEDFPIPRFATYKVHTKERDIRGINSTSWFLGNKCDNKPGETTIDYKLCKKTTSEKTEDFPCQ